MAGRIQLEVVESGAVKDTLTFDQDTIEVGKLSRSDLRLNDENISRRHARITVDAEGRVQLVDLGSTNGTRLNGMRINKAFLSDGDEIEVGITKLKVRLDDRLRKAAAMHAPSQRTGLSRDGYYRTQEGSQKGRRMGLEAALLWEDSAVQVDAVERVFFPIRLRAVILFLFAIGPFELWTVAVLAALLPALPQSLAIAAGAAGLGLAIYFIMDIDAWRTLLVSSVSQFRKGEAVYVGETQYCRFFVPSETIGQTEYPLMIPHRKGWALNLRNTEIRGDILHEGKVLSIEEARSSGLVKNNLLPVERGTKCRLRFGQFSMLLSNVVLPPKPKGAFISTISVQELAYMAVSLMIHFGMLILFVYLQPEDDIQIRRNNNAAIARLMNIESIKEKEDEKKDEEEDEFPEKVEIEEPEEVVDLEEASVTVQESEKFIKEEQDVKLQDRQERQNKPLTVQERVVQKQRNQLQAKRTAERMIPTQMLATLTGQNLLARPTGNTGLKIIGGGGDMAGDSGEMGAFASDTVAANGVGYAGLDNFGGTDGVGGPGGLDAKGRLIAGLDKERKNGKGKRFGKVRFKETKQRAVVTTGRVSVTGGALTKAIIKKYINRQKGSIILCYKREVQKKPNLEGKVVVAFTISPTGKVMRPSIKRSTLGSKTVESCIVGRLGFWRFPAPQNGGATRVSYPFLFRTR